MKFIHRFIRYLRFYGGRYECIVCGRPVRRFFRFSLALEQQAKEQGFPYDFHRVETLNFERCNCPFCLSSDRERLYLIYLEKFFRLNPVNFRILDFAPNKCFSDYLKTKAFVQYTSCDLFRNDVDVKVDVCDMTLFDENTFDIVIFSHVLEHVALPLKALSEIHRVLKVGGFAIIMVPLFLDVKDTVEDPSHVSEEQRLKYYGQTDHVRLYSKRDFSRQLADAKFVVKEITPKDLDHRSVVKNAIADDSVLYISCKKQHADE